jgi:hypothetical protein
MRRLIGKKLLEIPSSDNGVRCAKAAPLQERSSKGWMKLALRAQICSQCHPVPQSVDPLRVFYPHSCETNCALFVQLPRLARLLERYRAKPPFGYEEFVLKLLCDSGAIRSDGGQNAMHCLFLDYSHEALAIMERVVSLHIPELAKRDMGELPTRAQDSCDVK